MRYDLFARNFSSNACVAYELEDFSDKILVLDACTAYVQGLF